MERLRLTIGGAFANNRAQNAEAATWKGLLQRGLSFSKDVKNWSESSPNYLNMRKNIEEGRYLEAAEELSTLSPGNKRKFFGETVGRLSVRVHARPLVNDRRVPALWAHITAFCGYTGRHSPRRPPPTEHSRNDNQLR
jgi:hypothetical protein